MRNYSIYEHEVLPLKCIKNGWNWLAFFFQGIWCLIKKIYGIGSIVLLINILGITMASFPNLPSVYILLNNIISVILSIFLGVKGFKLYSNSLISKGYKLTTTFKAKNSAQAIKLFLDDKSD